MVRLPTLSRARAHVAQRRRTAAFAAGLKPVPRRDLISVGHLRDGAYIVPASLLGPKSVCYLAGAGEDITFDLGVIERFGCTVYALDPIPRVAEYVAVTAAHEPRMVFRPVALWSSDTTLTFHAPPRPGYVSRSAVNLYGTPPELSAPARSLASLMKELGHDHVDLLKLSVAGAEYEILGHVLAEEIDVRIICVEYSQPAPIEWATESVEALERGGYVLVAADVRTWTWKLTFVSDARADRR
jgi:FkbM family methyltransferase